MKLPLKRRLKFWETYLLCIAVIVLVQILSKPSEIKAFWVHPREFLEFLAAAAVESIISAPWFYFLSRWIAGSIDSGKPNAPEIEKQNPPVS